MLLSNSFTMITLMDICQNLYSLEGTTAAYTDFGEFDEDSGIWKPIENDQSGNKGANGFYLRLSRLCKFR
jgi:hypothetical protein